jgi:hypothetical protein
MKPRRPAVPRESISAPPVTFKAGDHTLSIAYVADGRWTVSVDGAPDPRIFRTQVEAWEAGVHTAAQLDQVERTPG